MRHYPFTAFLLVGLAPSWARAQVPAGGEFQVNTYTTDEQRGASVASDAAGNFVVTWASRAQDGNDSGVFAQRYDAAGLPRGGEFQVNDTPDYQFRPSVASAARGDFVVAWASTFQDGSGLGIFARRYDAAGQARGSAFQVNTYTSGYQTSAAVASDPVGNFVVTWQGPGQDGSGFDVFARRFDSSGQALGAEFQVNTYTTGFQSDPSIASDAAGNFVVAWASQDQDGDLSAVMARRYDAAGQARGAEFQVNTFTTDEQYDASVAVDDAGNFFVAWQSYWQDGFFNGIFARRFDASGTPRGGEFQVNTETLNSQRGPTVASDATGNVLVAWSSAHQALGGVFAQRYDAEGQPRGGEFQVNSSTTGSQYWPSAASDAVGNLVVAWESGDQDGSASGIFAQRLGGIAPAALAVDTAPSAGSDGNGVLEPDEAAVALAPAWRNVNGASQMLTASALGFSGPSASGVSYLMPDAAGGYGTVPDGATATCSDCYLIGLGFGGTRPSTHWDATFTERLLPDALGQTKPWPVHVGESFGDVPKTSPFYRFVEALLHRGVTGGCSATDYCPASVVTREQLSVLALVGKEGAGYAPLPCATPAFADVPASSPFCSFIAELARRGVVSGCGGGNYCPTSPVTREQMPVFVLRLLDPALEPPACGTPMFADVPASSPFCRWIHELARRGVVAGCGDGNYCPTQAVTREQMAVFISVAFGLTLYGS